MIQNSDSAPLGLATKISYGMGQVVWGCKDILFQVLLLFHYQQNLGLSGTLLGIGAVMALAVDAISDPLVGHMSDRVRTRLGRRHPFMMIALLPTAACFYAILNPPMAMGEMALFAWYVSFSVLARICVTFFTVPHTTLAAELSSDYLERTSLYGFRIGFGYLSALLLQIVIFAIVLSDAKGGLAYMDGYQLAAIIFTVTAIIAGVWSIVGTLGTVDYLKRTMGHVSDAPWWHALHEFWQALSLRNFRLFMASSIAYGLLLGVSQSLILHMLDFYYEFGSTQKAAVMAMVLLAIIPAHLTAKRLAASMGKAPAAMLTLILGGVFGAGHVTLKLFGILPESGTTSLLMWILALIWLNQTFLIAYLMIQGSMIGDMVDEYAVMSGKRQPGVFAAAQVFISKIPFGFGVLAAGVILDIAGFTPSMVPGTVDIGVLNIFGWFVGPGMFLVVLIAAFPLKFYDLSKERLEQLRASLQNAS